MTNLELATWLHDNYEGLAKAFQWETQESTRVPFEELPIKNRCTMLALADRMNNAFLIISPNPSVSRSSPTSLEGCPFNYCDSNPKCDGKCRYA